MTINPDFTPSDIYYRLLDLGHQMQAVNDILREMDYCRQDGSRIGELDRIAGMHSIAMREAERICDLTSVFDAPANFEKLGLMMLRDAGTSSAAVDSTWFGLENAKVRYEASNAKYRAKETRSEESDEEWKERQSAQEAFIKYPCTSLDDVRVKTKLLLGDSDALDTLRNCRDKNGDSIAVAFLKSLLGEPVDNGGKLSDGS